MEKKVNAAANLLATLISILFVITAFGSILMIDIMDLTLNPELYKKALSGSGIYERLPQLIGEQIVYSVNSNPCVQDPTTCTEEQLVSTPAYLSSVDASAWAAILSKLMDPGWFKIQTESVIDQIMAFLKTPGQSLSLDISLVEFKTRLGGEDGYQAVVSLINSLEPCTTGNMLNLLNAVLGVDELTSVSLCRPSESVLKLGEDAIRSTLKGVADELPNNTSTIFQVATGNLGTELVAAQRALQVVRTASQISPVIPLFLLLVITLLVVRSLKSFLKWWGIPLVATGALTFLSTLLITPLVRAFLLVQVNALSMAPGLLDVIKIVIMNITQSFRSTLVVQAGILCLIGCLMVVVAQLLRPKSGPIPN